MEGSYEQVGYKSKDDEVSTTVLCSRSLPDNPFVSDLESVFGQLRNVLYSQISFDFLILLYTGCWAILSMFYNKKNSSDVYQKKNQQ